MLKRGLGLSVAATVAMSLMSAGCREAPPNAERVASEKPRVEAEVERAPKPLMSWGDLTAQALPSPTTTIRYRDGDAGVIDLWRPDGSGPHPVVVMIHGGCWQKAIADRELMNYAAEALRTRGYAVWNIEYRGVDEPGGGYPGTFTDVAQALDALADHAAQFDLDTDAIVAFGHSAGGHLAAWSSVRHNLPPTSPLYVADPLHLDVVINSGGLADLQASIPVTSRGCLGDIAPALTGKASLERPDVFADTSPVNLLPPTATQISVNGEKDRIAPPELGRAYTEKVTAAGGEAMFIEIPGEGHVELIAPGSAAFDRQVELIDRAFATSPDRDE